jgi:hypothetical protein
MPGKEGSIAAKGEFPSARIAHLHYRPLGLEDKTLQESITSWDLSFYEWLLQNHIALYEDFLTSKYISP